MKFEVIKEKLQRAVSIADRATGKKLPLAILGKILLEVGEKEVSIRSTNLDLGVEMKVPAKVSKRGRVALSGALIDSYLATLAPQTTVGVELIGSNLSLTTPNSSVLVATEAPDDFPGLPVFGPKDGALSLVVEADRLLEGLTSVVFSVSNSEIKPELAGVYIYEKAGELVFAATDSFRLAEKRVEHKSSKGTELAGLIIPGRNCQELIKALSDSTGQIEIEYTRNQIIFASRDWRITSRLVDGNFPAYSHLIPSSFRTQVVALKEDIQSALRLTHVFADRFHQVTVRVIPDESLFEIQTKNQEVGESSVLVDATLEGEPLELSVNARYILDCFQIVSKDSVTLGFNGKDKAMLLRSVGDRSFSYLLMPLNR